MKPQQVFVIAQPTLQAVARDTGRASLSRFLTLSIASLAGAILFANTNALAAGNQNDFVKGHILVQPRPGLSDEEFGKALAPHGGSVARQIGNLGVYVVAFPATA